jgi:hypothetical protein
MATKRIALHVAAVLLLILMTSPVQAAGVHLAWDPPEADSASSALSTLAGYKLYYGQSEAAFSDVFDVGNQLSYPVIGLESGQTYYFVVTAYDDLGNESDISNVVVYSVPETGVDQTGADTVADTDDGTTSGSEVFDDAGEEVAASAEVEELASSQWTNYRVTLTLGSATAEDIGVMFRYQDSDNYYRLSWSQQHAERRLVKCENGVFTLLAVDTALDGSKPSYELTIAADGMTLEIWINSTQIFSVTDADFPHGTIALYALGRGVNVFDNVLVEDLATDEVLLWDDFNDGGLMGWTFLDDATGEASSTWSVEAGMLVQRSTTEARLYDPADLVQRGTFALYLN